MATDGWSKIRPVTPQNQIILDELLVIVDGDDFDDFDDDGGEQPGRG